MNRKRTAVSLAALALGAGTLTGLTAAPAQATGNCRETVGPGQYLSINGYDIGLFYEGFDLCTRATYAEFRFDDLWVSQQATGKIEITRDDGLAQATNGAPRGVTFWDAGYLPVPTSGVESFTAAFTFSWWTGSRYATCQGFSNWDYHTGTPLGADSECS